MTTEQLLDKINDAIKNAYLSGLVDERRRLVCKSEDPDLWFTDTVEWVANHPMLTESMEARRHLLRTNFKNVARKEREKIINAIIESIESYGLP